MTGSLILAGTDRYIAIMGGEPLTTKGRLIVATTEQERKVLVGKVVRLPSEWISVTEWVGGPDELARLARVSPEVQRRQRETEAAELSVAQSESPVRVEGGGQA